MQSNSVALGAPISGFGIAAETSTEISRLLLDALECIDDDESSAIDLVKRASTLLQPAYERAATLKAPSSGGLAAWQIAKLRAFIESRIDGGISLGELAAVARLSASYFSVAFKASFGLPPHAYVMERRIEHAKEQMLNTDLPLCEIALNCGLADQAHLSRIFKRMTGSTPSAWRRIKVASRAEYRRPAARDQLPAVAI